FGDRNPMIVEWIANAGSYLIFLLLARLFIKSSTIPFKERFGSLSLSAVPWTKLLLLKIGLFIFSLSFSVALMRVMSGFNPQVLKDLFLSPVETVRYLPTSIVTITLVPFVEEVIFRGILLKELTE